MGCEDISCASSSSSAGSIGSFSSGYGSQSTVVAKGEITTFDVKASPSPKSPSIKSNVDAPFRQSISNQNKLSTIDKNQETQVPLNTSLNVASNLENKKVVAVKGNTTTSSIYKPSQMTNGGKFVYLSYPFLFVYWSSFTLLIICMITQIQLSTLVFFQL